MGCHSHKVNKSEIEICSTLDEVGKTSDCISCHMPTVEGAPTKLNAKARLEHTSHKFLGIHSQEMVQKAVKLKLTQLNKNSFELEIKNKMGHSIITQPMRLKYVKTIILRNDKIVWSNFKSSPYEDTEATFAIIFKDKNNKATLPAYAKGYKYNTNLKAKQDKRIIYSFNNLKKGDLIKASWISYIIAPKIAKKLKIEDIEVQKKSYGQTIKLVVK
jgi:hypothetical protein